MESSSLSRPADPRQRPSNPRRAAPLAACLASALGAILTPVALATTFPVGRCNDTAGKGGDTLRIAIGKAGNNDVVDLSTTAATCSTITLTAGEIPIGVDNLTISGPADRTITVSGNNVGRVFYHTGGGILHLYTLALSSGHTSGSGGCVFSNGQVWLYSAAMSSCTAALNGGCIDSQGETFLNHQSSLSGCNATQKGGGIHSLGSVILNASSISGATAYDGAGIEANGASGTVALLASSLTGNTASSEGGAAVAYGDANIGASVISGNMAGYSCGGLLFLGNATLTSTTVAGNSAATGSGGGVCMRTLQGATKTLTLNTTTVSGNSAHLFGGGVDGHGVTAAPYGPDMHFSNSTISGNSAGGGGGGVYMYFGRTRFANSTIAFNQAPTGGGVYAVSPNSVIHCFVEAHSTIFMSNSGSTVGADMFLNPNCFIAAASTVDNLINSSNTDSTDGWFHGLGGLAPLAYHGGTIPTKTHALLANSVALNRGGNPDNLSYDQRGPGFDRSVGTHADIGAYERQPMDDEIFYDGLE